MDQFAQTNDLQQAIDNVANGGNAADASNGAAQFGIPPMPPVPENGNDLPEVKPLVPPEDNSPSAEQILSQSITSGDVANNAGAVGNGAAVSAPEPVAEVVPAPVEQSVPVAEAMPADGNDSAVEVAPEVQPAEDLSDVKQNILKDLLPLLDKTEKTPEEKFEIYRDAISTMHDVKTVEGAYKTATQIEDEAKKAEALFTLMKVIDGQ